MENAELLNSVNDFNSKVMELKEREISLLGKALKLMKEGKTEEGAKVLSFDNVSVILNELFEVSENFSREIVSKIRKTI